MSFGVFLLFHDPLFLLLRFSHFFRLNCLQALSSLFANDWRVKRADKKSIWEPFASVLAIAIVSFYAMIFDAMMFDKLVQRATLILGFRIRAAKISFGRLVVTIQAIWMFSVPIPYFRWSSIRSHDQGDEANRGHLQGDHP